MNDRLRSNAMYALIPTALMLYFGWRILEPWSRPDSFFQSTGNILCWTLRVGGFAMLGVAILYLMGLRVGRLADAVVSGVCGVVMALCGVYGVIHSGLGALQSMLYVIFGGMFLRDAIHAWRSFKADCQSAGAASSVTNVPPVTPTQPESPHPASIRPSTLSNTETQPPPDGYLAALSKEDDKPPTASYE